MEENQAPNPNQFNIAGNGNVKKKKGMGPLKGLLLAILMVFLICVIGLLIRMVVVGDGDYFKPIKDIFGIEEDDKDEDDEEKESKVSKKTSSEKKSSGNSKFQAIGKYALLSDDVDGKNVKHYRLTVDMGELFDLVMKELSTESNGYDNEYYSSDNDEFDWNEYEDTLDEFNYLEDEYDESKNSSNEFNQFENMMGMAMMLMQEMADMIDGEMYFDIYFEGNEIVQIVIGYDYSKLLENLYDYMLDEAEDELEDEGINSVEDLADMIVEEFDAILDKDTLYDMIMDSSDEDIESQLKEFGIKEKDIKDAVDFNNDKGVIEIYINGTTKLKALISMGLESESFQEEIKAMEKETGVKIDEDNIIESILEAANESDEYSDFGFEFVEVN